MAALYLRRLLGLQRLEALSTNGHKSIDHIVQRIMRYKGHFILLRVTILKKLEHETNPDM